MKVENLKVVTNEVRLSYASLIEPRIEEGKDPQYETSVLIPKSDKEMVDGIKAVITKAGDELKSKFRKDPKSKSAKMPLHDGDEDRPEDPAYAGHYFLSARTKRKPQIINRKRELLDTEDDVYSGMYARVSINFFPFVHSSGSFGVGVGLNSVLKERDGERLAGASSAFDDFGDELEEDDFM